MLFACYLEEKQLKERYAGDRITAFILVDGLIDVNNNE